MAYSQKIKRLPMSYDLFIGLFKNVYDKVEVEGFPEDGEISYVNYNPEQHTFELIIRSETFEPVIIGNVVPYLDLTIRHTKHKWGDTLNYNSFDNIEVEI